MLMHIRRNHFQPVGNPVRFSKRYIEVSFIISVPPTNSVSPYDVSLFSFCCLSQVFVFLQCLPACTCLARNGMFRGFYCALSLWYFHSYINYKTQDVLNIHSPWHSLSFKSWPRWCHCRDDRTRILTFCIRCCLGLSRYRDPDTLRPWFLTRGDYRRHPREPPVLTFHYIFHYISHPFSWWQSVPWLLRRGNALHRAHIILSHTHWYTPVCTHTHTHTTHSSLHWLTPDYSFPFWKVKGRQVMTSMTPHFDLLLSR